ncbi:MAG: NAD(P)-binding protein [Nannocystaceae bacterium]|nr:NAD(P)-binding protein [Nannocystaceae bacterium]
MHHEQESADDLADALARAHDDGLPERGSALTEGRGSIDTVVLVCALPAERVRAMLPAGLQLAPQPLLPPDRHLVLVSCAHDRFGAWFGDMDYHELMFAIPWVELADERAPHPGPFLYMPRLFLDATVPQVLGERVYGYEKLSARIQSSEGRFVAHDDAGDLLIDVEYAPDGEARAPDAWPNFAWTRMLLEQPTLSQAARRLRRDARDTEDAEQRFLGSTVRYLFEGEDWDGKPVDAEVTPVRARVQFGNGIDLPLGLPQQRWESPSVAAHVLGALRLRAPQVVSLPGSPTVVRAPHGGRKLRVAVLGGGPAALAAAFWLGRQRDRFEVSLYTMGHRLGGKCAASRNPDACDRIEEHGLHAFPGFYRNAFRTVRALYGDLGRALANEQGPIGAAFRGQRHVGVLDRFDDRWRYFPTPIDPNDREPGGVPLVGRDAPVGLGRALKRMFGRIGDEIATLGEPEREPAATGLGEALIAPWRDALQTVLQWAEREAADAVERFVETPPAASALKRGLLAALRQVRDALASRWRGPAQHDPEVWFRWGGVDTLLTIAIGVLEESTLDFDDLDDHDFVTWLAGWGLAPEHRNISTVMMVYETLFAHGDGVPYTLEHLACGVGLRWFLLVSFGYDGFAAYDFEWACSETLIGPYYDALVQHGVAVHFFHRVERLEFEGSGDDKALARVRMRVQATPAAAHYQPMRPAPNPERDPPVWPLRPDYAQLREGDALRQAGVDLEDVYDPWPGVGERVLQQGVDFDACILGIPLGALPPVLEPLLAHDSPHFDPSWRRFVDETSLVQTLSVQLWFDRGPDEMFAQHGRTMGHDHVRGLLTGFAQPQASLGQFTHLVAHERWPDPRPQLLTYHTGALQAGVAMPRPEFATREFPASERERARGLAEAFFREHHDALFDGVAHDFDAFLAALRVPPQHADAVGVDRLRLQAFNLACQPSDLYILSRPGQTRLRPTPTGSGARFLLLVGDWTKTDLNCGCVEAATQSAMLAARALSGEPVYVWRVGF